jgi:hypothetical protein
VPAAQDGSVDADQVAEVEGQQAVEGLPLEHVQARVQLDLPAAVDEVQEGRPARAAPREDPAGDPVIVLGLLAALQLLVGGKHIRDRLGVREGVRERARVGLAQALGLGAPLGDQLLQPVPTRLVGGRALLASAHGGEPTGGRRRSW